MGLVALDPHPSAHAAGGMPLPRPRCGGAARACAVPRRPGPSGWRRLAIPAQALGRLGRAPVFELPLRLPEQFDLVLEVWGDRAALARSRVVGQRLGPLDPADTPEIPPEPETWHLVQLKRGPGGLSLSVDGQPVPTDPDIAQITPRLASNRPPVAPPDSRISASPGTTKSLPPSSPSPIHWLPFRQKSNLGRRFRSQPDCQSGITLTPSSSWLEAASSSLSIVNDRLTRLYSAQQDAVQRSTGWDWICAMVVDQPSAGCRGPSI